MRPVDPMVRTLTDRAMLYKARASREVASRKRALLLMMADAYDGEATRLRHCERGPVG